MTSEKAANKLKEKFSAAEIVEFRGEYTAIVALDEFRAVIEYCRKDLNFELLLDITSVDQYGEDPRFEVLYELATLDDAAHLRVKVKIAEEVEVPTVTDIWGSADWHEREVYDMMGIKFAGHPNLKRILMWEGYPFHPMRKEFPLEGLPSEMPDVGFSDSAPMADGPFVTCSGGGGSRKAAEPRSRAFTKPEEA